MAGAKKKARRERRILVFIDESGLSQRPHRCRTWAPRGQTPILQYNFNWKTLSVAAGLTLWNFYFRIYAGAIKKEQVVDFLAALVRHLGQPLLIVWDRLPGHRSRLVREYIAGLQGWSSTAYLPPYAPELNPVEYIWGYWKQHELPNVCPKDYWQLSEAARRTLRRMRRRPRLINAFWQQSGTLMFPWSTSKIRCHRNADVATWTSARPVQSAPPRGWSLGCFYWCVSAEASFSACFAADLLSAELIVGLSV